MGWTVRYSLVGNATRLYSVARPDSIRIVFGASVKEVARITGRSMQSVRIACKEAREHGVSDFLD